MPKNKYIAVHGFGNNYGVGVVEIDHSVDMITFEVLNGDRIVEICNEHLYEVFNEKTEEFENIFYWGKYKHKFNLSEFIRTDY